MANSLAAFHFGTINIELETDTPIHVGKIPFVRIADDRFEPNLVICGLNMDWQNRPKADILHLHKCGDGGISCSWLMSMPRSRSSDQVYSDNTS